MKKRIIPAILSLALLLVALLLVQAVLIPSRYDNREGHLLCGYYDTTDAHDVIFVGDCEIYEGIVPAVLYERYGITSYVRGSSQQTVWQSYYVLEETLAKEPDVKVVVFNVLALKYGETPKESISRMTLEDMRWSASKLQAIRASMTEEESLLSYFVPILRYHDRWSSLTKEDGERIAAIMLGRIAQQLGNQGIMLEYSDAVIAHLAQQGVDAMSGARNLRRVGVVGRV